MAAHCHGNAYVFNLLLCHRLFGSRAYSTARVSWLRVFFLSPCTGSDAIAAALSLGPLHNAEGLRRLGTRSLNCPCRAVHVVVGGWGSCDNRHEDILPFTPDDLNKVPKVQDEMSVNEDATDAQQAIGPLDEDAPVINLYVTSKHGIEVTGFASCVKRQRQTRQESAYQFYYTIMFHNTSDVPVRLVERTLLFAEDFASETVDIITGLVGGLSC